MENSLSILVGVSVFLGVYFGYPIVERQVMRLMKPKRKKQRQASPKRPLYLEASRATPLGDGSMERSTPLRRVRY